jgi:hypothetical protein
VGIFKSIPLTPFLYQREGAFIIKIIIFVKSGAPLLFRTIEFIITDEDYIPAYEEALTHLKGFNP